jgi:hypothetical protein
MIGALNGKITLNLENTDGVEPGSSLAYTVDATTWARQNSDVTAGATLQVLEGEDLVSVENGKLTFGDKEGKVVLLASYSTKMGGIPYTLYDQPIVIEVKASNVPNPPEDEIPPVEDGSEPTVDGSENEGNVNEGNVNEGNVNEGTGNEGTENNGSNEPKKDEGSSMILIIVIAAIGVAVIGAAVFFFLKKKK